MLIIRAFHGSAIILLIKIFYRFTSGYRRLPGFSAVIFHGIIPAARDKNFRKKQRSSRAVLGVKRSDVGFRFDSSDDLPDNFRTEYDFFIGSGIVFGRYSDAIEVYQFLRR